MSKIQRMVVKDSEQEYEFYVESPEKIEIAEEEPEYRDINLPTVDMKKVHATIRGYARYAVGAFVNFGLAEVEEMNLEFNLKIAGKAGLPVLTEASAEGSFKIQVKCKFPEPSAEL
jgi:hypothetical protein